MYSGMMDPELMKIAQEQMSRISPDELAKIQQQMMSNPDLMRLASESMKNLRPEDLKNAAEQLKHTRTEDMVEIGEKMAKATPEEVAAMHARGVDQVSYELSAAQMLKKQGNDLHNLGKYSDAAQKYLLAKNNLKGAPISKGRTLQLVCSLNLMSCYLKMRKYEDCIKEGSEVLAYDAENIKALYRRGQAYKELGRLQNAVTDLSKASAISSDDETISEVLRDAKELLANECDDQNIPRRLVIEEIEEDTNSTTTNCHQDSATAEFSMTEPQEAGESSQSQDRSSTGISDNHVSSTEAESLQSLKDNPEAIRSFHNFIANANPDSLAALSGGGLSPDMVKTMSDMLSKMSPEELQKMIEIASSVNGKNRLFNSVTTDANSQRLTIGSESSGFVPAVNESREVGESSSQGSFPNSRTSPIPSTIPTSTTDMQEQIRNQMKNPAMMQMFSSMVKNMSPDMMANMSEQFGINLSREEAAKAQQAMTSLSPGDLERMMRWAEKLQRAAEGARKTKNWLLGRPGMILAVCILLLSIVLHWMGYIGG